MKPSGADPFRVGLDTGPVTVGRSSSSRVRLADDPKVSREHCRFERRGDVFVVVDLGSPNGTRVGGTKISGPQELWHKDVIGVGSAQIVFEDPSRARAGIASSILKSIGGLFGRGDQGSASGASDAGLLAKGRMRCPGCGTVLNVSGKSPGEKVGCPRCRRVHRVPRQ